MEAAMHETWMRAYLGLGGCLALLAAAVWCVA